MNDVMAQGGVLMLLGMGIVFSFLGVLVAALHLMSKFLRDTEQPMLAPVENDIAQTGGSTDLQDPELISAITAAVHSFRAKRGLSSSDSK